MVNIQSLVATKAARIVHAACSDGHERSVVDFGARRAHGPEAGSLAARAAYIGGCDGTSNLLAGRKFGIPTYGTMAHSWVEAFDKEEEAFHKYHKIFPEGTVLLVDTYDTVKAVRMIVNCFIKDRIKGVRLDSGNLHVCGNLNEYKILDLVQKKSPIDIFGVGTHKAIE